MVNLKWFSMTGAFSYGECQVDFRPGLVLLEGRNLDEGEKVSNMAGKTSIFDGISTVLFEDNSKSQVKDALINVFGSGVADMRLGLEIGSKTVEIKYSRGKSDGWHVVEDGQVVAKSLKEMKKYINELIGMDYNMFVMSSYIEQGRMSKFAQMGDVERKKLLYSYFGLDKFDIFRAKIKDVKGKVYGGLVEVASQIKHLEQSGSSDEKGVIELLEKQVAKYKGKPPVEKKSYHESRKKYLEILEIWKNRKFLQEQKTVIVNDLNIIGGRIEWCKEVIKKVAGNKCYICDSEIDGTQLKNNAEKELVELHVVKGSLVEELAKVDNILGKLSYWVRRDKLTELIDMRSRVGSVETWQKAVEELAKKKTQLEYKLRIKEELNELKQKQSYYEGMQDALEFWFEGFGPKGIPAMVLDKLLTGLNSYLAKYSNIFGWSVKCSIKDDKLVLDVKDRWKSLKVNYFSGSENMIVSMIIAFGIWDWLYAKGKGTNVLFLDEVFAPFDAEMRLRMVEFLNVVAKNRCVVVVTHNEDVKNIINWDRIWVVEKKGGISNLQVY